MRKLIKNELNFEFRDTQAFLTQMVSSIQAAYKKDIDHSVKAAKVNLAS